MDVIFFIMPLHQITRLQLKSSQKMLLAMVFALGGLYATNPSLQDFY